MPQSDQASDATGEAWDADTLSRLRAGDRALFDEVVRRTHAPVYGLAMRLVRHGADAQEVVQETYLSAYRHISGFDGRAPVRSWLLSICYRKALDLLRARKLSPWQLDGDVEESPLWQRARGVDQFTDWGADPEQHYGRQEFRELLEKILQELPALSRAVFELRDVQGMSTREAADILDSTEGAVRVRLHRVRQVLTAELEGLLGRGRPLS